MDNTKLDQINAQEHSADFSIRLMTPDEYNFSYTQNPEIMKSSGCIGHLRADMDSNGTGFYSSWDNHTPELKTQSFKDEFDAVINALRFDSSCGGILKNRESMKKFLNAVPESKITEDGHAYGFRVDTDNHSYMMRLNPFKGEYAAYIYAYDREMLDQHLESTRAAEKLTVLVVEPEKAPYTKEITPGLKSLQTEVGGYIEAIYPYEDPVAIICNEEGKLNGLPLNRSLRDEDGKIYDVLAGTFLITGLGDEDFCSLKPDQIAKFSMQFRTPEMFMRYGDQLVVLPMKPPKEQKPTIKEKLSKAPPQKDKKPVTKTQDKGAR